VSGGRTRRPLWSLLAAGGISTFGTRMSFLALPWFVLGTTHSATATGAIALAEMAPYVGAKGLGGPWIDRSGAHRVSIGTDVVAALFVGGVPALAGLHVLAFPVLIALVATAGAARGAGDAARYVLVPGVGELAGAPLERSSGLFDGVDRLAALIGAPIAGALLVVISPLGILAIDAATFLVSAITVAGLVPTAAQPRRQLGATNVEVSYLSSLADGFRYLRTDRLLVGMALMVLVTNFVDQAGTAVLYPVWSRDIAHSSIALGLLTGVFSLGAVCGNALTTWLAVRLPRRLTYATGFFIAGAPRYLTIALAASVSPALVAVLLVSGLGAGGINPILGAVGYERVPRDLQARVLGAVGASAWAGIPLGSLIGGLAVTRLGLQASLLSAAALYAIATLPPFILPTWRQMDRSKPGQTCATDLIDTNQDPPGRNDTGLAVPEEIPTTHGR